MIDIDWASVLSFVWLHRFDEAVRDDRTEPQHVTEILAVGLSV